MIQDTTIEACRRKTSFKKHVTDYQTRYQKAILHTLFIVSMLLWLAFVYLLSRQLWKHASITILTGALTFGTTLALSRLFNTGIIRQRYPKLYRSWYRWDRKGFDDISITRIQILFRKRKIKSRRENLLISRISERIDEHQRHLTIINAVTGAALTTLLGALFSGLLILSLLFFPIAAIWLLAFTIWNAVGTLSGVDDLRELRRLVGQVCFLR